MSGSLIANRYAKAILEIVGSNDESAKSFSEFLEGAKQLFSIAETKKVLKSPVMPAELKRELLQYVAKKTNLGDGANRFIDQLIEAGRVSVLPEIFDAYSRMLDEKKGIAHATITTAAALSDSDQKSLQATLSNVFKKSLSVDNKVDPKVLGGLVVEVGNFSLDMSVRAKLDSLAEEARH